MLLLIQPSLICFAQLVGQIEREKEHTNDSEKASIQKGMFGILLRFCCLPSEWAFTCTNMSLACNVRK